MASYFRQFLLLGLCLSLLLGPAPLAVGAGPCQRDNARQERLKSWAERARNHLEDQLARVREWNRIHIGWTRAFDLNAFDRHRDQFEAKLKSLIPDPRAATTDFDPSSARLRLSERATPEEKLAFLEAVSSHFVSSSPSNPLRAERILDTRLRDFFAKRRFFKKLDDLNFTKLKVTQMEDLLVDLYTLQNGGNNNLPTKIRAMIWGVLPLNGDFYESWYRDAVTKRFYVEVMRLGLEDAMNRLNMPLREPLAASLRQNKIFRQFAGTGISVALNWYILIPMAHLFGFLHLPNINLSEWLPITRALQAELSKNPQLLDEIVRSGFRYELVESMISTYGLQRHGLRARFDVIYQTLRTTYLGLAVPPALYFFIAQFLPFDLPLIDQIMAHWDHLRWQLIPWLLPESGTGRDLDELIRPPNF
ncbi:MAG: hypothetical protein IT288_06915 [Bdellovibrionales bacterium]|nr:hypothetical protein [Bdellovibrionales bacterium]